jgi:hypothetical protein
MFRKKSLLIGIMLVLVLLVLANGVSARFSREDTLLINQCKKDCRIDKKVELNECRNEFSTNRNECKSKYKSCIEEQKTILESCIVTCENDRSCVRTCKKEYTKNKRHECNRSECRRNSSTSYRECRTDTISNYKSCSQGCQFTAFEKNITCLDGIYKAGDEFLEGCNSCTCKFTGEISCKKTKFCNFNNVKVDPEHCLASGGLFQGLCRGPYFGIGCSQKNYCLCEGINNYSCPSNHTCVTDFIPPRIKAGSIPGWKTLLGAPLGNIGICAVDPLLENCGNGICENILNGNVIAETVANCPIDCQN